MEVGKDVSLSISSTYGVDEAALLPTDEDGEVRISNEQNQQLNKELRWVSNLNSWIQTSFKFFEGQEIVLNTDFTNLGLGKTTASCIVPPKGVITSKVDAKKQSVLGIDQYNFALEFSELPENNYYHLKPYILQNGEQLFLNVNSTEEGTFSLTHMAGILIDYTTTEGVNALDFTVFSKDLSNPSISEIHLDLKTVPKAYYDYHKSLTVQKETQQGPFDAPVPTSTNIEGGQGIFIAYQTSYDSIEVQ